MTVSRIRNSLNKTVITMLNMSLLKERCRGISLVEEPETEICKFLNQAKNCKLSPDDYEVIKTIKERWDRDELIDRLCEELL